MERTDNSMLSALRDVIAKFTARGFFAVRLPPDTTLAEDLADDDLVGSRPTETKTNAQRPPHRRVDGLKGCEAMEMRRW